MSKLTKSKEQLLTTMSELAKGNILSISKKELANLSGFSTNIVTFNSFLSELEKEGKIILKEKAEHKGSKYWTNFVFEIIKEDKHIINKINVNDYINEKFNNINMRLYKTSNGYVVPISDIAKGLQIDRQAIHQLIDRNELLFNNFLVNVILTASKSVDNKCLTRDGVIGLLMKISLNRLPEEKQKLVLHFQKWAIEKLGELISNGKVELTEQEHSKVQNDFRYITGMTEEQIDSIFNDIDINFTKLLDSAKVTIKKLKKENESSNYEKEVLKKENQRWISNSLALKEKLLSFNIN